MPKKAPKKESPKLDMNPMVDMAFLLVSFFMLTTTFKTAEPIAINRPSSQSEIKVPERDVMTLTIGDEGQVFFSIDGKFAKKRLLQLIGGRHEIDFSEIEQEQFALLSSFGMPIQELSTFLKATPEDRKKIKQKGIPMELEQNELADWIVYSRIANPKLRIAINGDKDVAYPEVQKIINTLLHNKIYRFNLITEIEEGG